MLNRNELKEIAGLAGGSAHYVSLYLDVNPATNPRGEFAIWFKNEVKKTSESLDKGVLKAVGPDFEAMESYILGNRRDLKKGLVILSSKGAGFQRTYSLSVPIRNELVVNKAPYIKPLLEALDRNKRYAVLLVDKESARIFVVHLGEIVEFGEHHTEDVPGKHKKGGWFALSQNHYDRHIEEHVSLHLKDAVAKFEQFFRGEEIDRLLIGGAEDAIARTRGLLPAAVSEKIIGTFSAGLFEGNADVWKKVEPVISDYDRKAEEATVSDLIRKAMKQERATLGLENVLKAVRDGRVLKLVLDRDFKGEGLQCSACRGLTSAREKQCPYCNGALHEAGHVVDLAAQRAVEQGAAVEVVSGTEEFRRAGRIGAFLRF